jgi:hypothetical protein
MNEAIIKQKSNERMTETRIKKVETSWISLIMLVAATASEN